MAPGSVHRDPRLPVDDDSEPEYIDSGDDSELEYVSSEEDSHKDEQDSEKDSTADSPKDSEHAAMRSHSERSQSDFNSDSEDQGFNGQYSRDWNDEMYDSLQELTRKQNQTLAGLLQGIEGDTVEGDIIDLRTGRILEDKGHIRRMRSGKDINGLLDDQLLDPGFDDGLQSESRRLTPSEQLSRHMPRGTGDEPYRLSPPPSMSDLSSVYSVCLKTNPLLDWIVDRASQN